ncbi:MAG: PEP-CTERM sorting domain-containing protein [Verrucomicrobiota bacterium]
MQFNVSTLGYTDIKLSFDIRHSNTSSRYERVQYSLDGVNFLDSLGFTGAAGDTWFNSRTVDLTGIAGVANNANFAFRIVSEWESTATGSGANAFLASNTSSSYAASGTWRFDMVTIAGAVVPEPTALSLAGIGLAILAFRQRVVARR